MEKEQAPAKSASTTETPLFQWSGTGHAPAEDPASPSGDEDGPASPQENKAAAPAQKRRRVTRACDECRRKKIKCDGKQPCTHCTVYSYGSSSNQDLISKNQYFPQCRTDSHQNVHMISRRTEDEIPRRSMSRHSKVDCNGPKPS